jgi:hypothetical protein
MNGKLEYSLYQTFDANIPSTNLLVKDKKYLVEACSKLNRDQKIAFSRLILEHARLENIEVLDGLPYGGNSTDTKTEFNLENLPNHLKWILLKFVKICDEN